MVRDFTQETKDRLLNEIDDINKSTWNPVTDAIADVLFYAGKWLEIITLKDDMSNVESYQRTVLDMTDMTKRELEQIFEDVYAVDREYKGNFSEVAECEIAYNDSLKYLSSKINPNFSICSAATLRKEISVYNEKLRSASHKANLTFLDEVTWASTQAELEATKGIVSGVFKGVVDIVCLPASMVKNLVTRNYIGIVTETWDVINDVFAVGGNLVGLAILWIGFTVSRNTDMKNKAVKDSEAYSGVSGLTDVLEAKEKTDGESAVYSWMKKISQTIDTASAAYDLFSDCKDFLEDPKKMMDFDFGFEEYKPIKKADMVKEYQDDYRKWQSLYRNYVKNYHVIELKNISNVKDFLDPITGFFSGEDKGEWASVFGGGGAEAFKKSNKWYKALDEAYDLGEDICELFEIAS